MGESALADFHELSEGFIPMRSMLKIFFIVHINQNLKTKFILSTKYQLKNQRFLRSSASKIFSQKTLCSLWQKIILSYFPFFSPILNLLAHLHPKPAMAVQQLLNAHLLF